VIPETPLSKAQALLTGVLKIVNECRNHAFRLQPLKMSSDLISQLLAVGVKLESLANQLQENIKKGKDKNRYYVTIFTEVDKYSRMARERIELGKALVRAAEKAANPKAKPAAKPAKNATGEPA
ncbi:unnamed protein product, partial [Effrenium voratum]